MLRARPTVSKDDLTVRGKTSLRADAPPLWFSRSDEHCPLLCLLFCKCPLQVYVKYANEFGEEG